MKKQKRDLIVWTRAGGRCVICKRYLLDDVADLDGDVTKLADVAHIVGEGDDQAPRSDSGMSADDKNHPDNLMLLCLSDHRRADGRLQDSQYTIKRLHALKREHEQQIHALTALQSSPRSVVFRVVGTVRGRTVQADRLDVAAAVAAEHRVPEFLPQSLHNEVEVLLTGVPEDSPNFWEESLRSIRSGVGQIRDGVRRQEIPHVSVAAFARLPLLVALGAELDDTFAVSVLQRSRLTDSWQRPASALPVQFTHAAEHAEESPREIVLVLNLSGTIDANELPVAQRGLPRWTISPTGGTADVNIADAPGTAYEFNTTIRDVLGQLEETGKENLAQIHLFAAAPMSLAVLAGRALDTQILNSHQNGCIIVYDRDDGHYSPVVSIAADGSTAITGQQ